MPSTGSVAAQPSDKAANKANVMPMVFMRRLLLGQCPGSSEDERCYAHRIGDRFNKSWISCKRKKELSARGYAENANTRPTIKAKIPEKVNLLRSSTRVILFYLFFLSQSRNLELRRSERMRRRERKECATSVFVRRVSPGFPSWWIRGVGGCEKDDYYHLGSQPRAFSIRTGVVPDGTRATYQTS
jgi:hypothetical protein